MRRNLGILLLSTSALCAFVPIASAQTPPAAEGRRHFEQGLQYLNAGRFHDAAGEFEASLRIERRASVYYNLGLAQRGVGANRAAITAFRAYLAMDHDPSHVALSNRYIEELTASLGHVDLVIAPAAAHVRVDDEDVAPGTSRVDVDPGSHRIRIEAEGYAPENRTLEVGQRSAVEVRVTLVATPATATASATPVAPSGPVATPEPIPAAHLRVESNVAAATIRIDGRDVGTGTADLETEAGTHSIEATAPHRQTYRAQVTVHPGERLRVSASLAGEPLATGVLVGVGVGAGVIVVGAVILGVVLATTPRAPYEGTWGTVTPR